MNYSLMIERGGLHAPPFVPRLDSRSFLDLGNEYALAADRNQWILCKARTLHGVIKWQSESFIESGNSVLARIMKEKGISVPPDADTSVNAFFDTPPHDFLEWRKLVCVVGREFGNGGRSS